MHEECTQIKEKKMASNNITSLERIKEQSKANNKQKYQSVNSILKSKTLFCTFQWHRYEYMNSNLLVKTNHKILFCAHQLAQILIPEMIIY